MKHIKTKNATYYALINASRNYRTFNIRQKYWNKYVECYNNNNNNDNIKPNEILSQNCYLVIQNIISSNL